MIPYDGNDVGSFNPDTTAIGEGYIQFPALAINQNILAVTSGNFVSGLIIGTAGDIAVATSIIHPGTYQVVRFRVPRPGNETAGAWLAVDSYISY